jgi:ribosomal protein S27E
MFQGLLVAIAVALIAYAASSLRRGGRTLGKKACRRVFVFDCKAKRAAILHGHYEWVPMDEASRSLLCDQCVEVISSSKSEKEENAITSTAYTCANCGRLVWRDSGGKVI